MECSRILLLVNCQLLQKIRKTLFPAPGLLSAARMQSNYTLQLSRSSGHVKEG